MANKNEELKHDINFFAVLHEYEKEQKRNETRTNVVPKIALVIALILGGLYAGGVALQNVRMDAQIEALKGYVENSDNQAVYKARSSIQDELGVLIDYNKSCTAYIEALTNAPRVSKQGFDAVHALIPADTSVLDFAYAEPVLSVRCKTSDKKAPAAYAKSLSESGRFTDVTYTGFDAINSAEETDMFVFTIECRLW